MKRWIPFLLIICVVLLLPAVSVSARAADTFGACGDNLTWTFDEATGTLTIEGTGPMWDWDSIDPPWHSHPIKSAVIRNGVTSIGIVAFSGCYSLSEVSIPDSVTSIGDYAFTCTSLTDITVDSNNPKYCSVDGVLFDKYKTRLIQYPTEKNASNYIIPDSTTFIGEHAFSNCDSLTEVTIPDSVTYIGDSAFEDCNSLTEVTIPDSVTYIGDRAFTYCLSLTDITVDNNNTHYCSVDGVLFDKSKTTLIQYPAGKETKDYLIPNGVTTIGDYAFSYCHNSLSKVTIPDGVTSIGEWAFAWCNQSLTQVTIGNSVISIEDYAFYACYSLTDVYYIGTEAQWDAMGIESDNDPLLNATIHYAFDAATGSVSIPWLPEGAESALIAAYGDGKLICTVTGQVENENYIPLTEQPDEIRIFYLGGNYQPVTAPDITRLD